MWINYPLRRTFYTPHSIRRLPYSSKLVQYSKYYKTFSNILEVRTISGEYLIAMKLMSARNYKNDLSDIVGILIEHEKMGKSLTFEEIKKAIINLYGDYDKIPDGSKHFIEDVFKDNNYRNYYFSLRDSESKNFNSLIDFEIKYPDVLTSDNLNEILKSIRSKQK